MIQTALHFCDPGTPIPSDFILCGSSALEFMGWFSGYTTENHLYVYQKAGALFRSDENPNYIVIPMPKLNLDHVLEHANVHYTSFDQTINDMLSNPVLEDPQAIMEALGDYLDVNHGRDPEILPENKERYLAYKKASMESRQW
jgi:hypothetical protein